MREEFDVDLSSGRPSRAENMHTINDNSTVYVRLRALDAVKWNSRLVKVWGEGVGAVTMARMSPEWVVVGFCELTYRKYLNHLG